MTPGPSHEIELSKVLLSKIAAFDFGQVVDKYTRDHKVRSAHAAEILVELQRWLTLCVLHPEKEYTVGGSVDEMWHTFILFTKDYARFCQDTTGAFIHHSPAPGSDDPQEQKILAQRVADRARLLEADYTKYFGAAPPSHIWRGQQKPKEFETAFAFLEAMAR